MVTILLILFAGLVSTAVSTRVAAISRLYGESRGMVISGFLRNLGNGIAIIAFILAYGWPGERIFAPSILTNLLSLILILSGLLLALWGHLILGMRSHFASAKDSLIQHGPYAWVRHPIFWGLAIFLLGLFLINPTEPLGLVVLITVLWLPVQAWLEEQDLRQRMPSYLDYARRVPMFIPRLGT